MNAEQMENQREEIEKWVRFTGLKGTMSRTAKHLLPGKRFSFNLNLGGGSYTDGKRVVVGIPELVFPMKKEVIFSVTKALVGHETEHIASSDFDVFVKFQQEVKEYFRKHYNLRITPKLGAHLLNSTEDGRIEKRLINRFRGYKKHIQLLNGIFWSHQPCEGDNEMMNFLYSFTTMCVTGLKSKEWEKHYEGTEADALLDQIRPLMMKAINNPTARGCADDTMEIVEIVAPFMARMLEDLKNQKEIDKLSDKPQYKSNTPQEGGASQPGSSQSSHFLEPEEEEKKESGDSEEEDSDESDSEDKSDDKSDEDSESKKSDTQTDETEEESEKSDEAKEDEKPRPTEEEIEQFMEEMLADLQDEVASEAEKAIEQGQKEAERELAQEERENVFTGHLVEEDMKGLNANVVFRQLDPVTQRTFDMPPEVLNRGRLVNKELKTVFLNKQTFNSRNRRSGQLDTNALWKKGINDFNMFVKKGAPKDTSYAINVLVDASGSMKDFADDTRGATKLEKATEAIAMIEEGLRDLVPVRITYFTAGWGQVLHSTVKDFDQKSKDTLSWKRLPAFSSMANQDGYSIKVATRELLKRLEKKKILIILSDGLPTEPSESKGQREVQEAVREARKAGVIVIAIAFGSDQEMENNREVYKEMYQNGIIMARPDEIHKYLAKTIKTEINQ